LGRLPWGLFPIIVGLIIITKQRMKNAMKKKGRRAVTPAQETYYILSGKWTVVVLDALGKKQSRFGALEKELRGISPRTLSLCLARLEKNSIVTRVTFKEVPPRVEYKLTPKGKTLLPILRLMDSWAKNHAKE
jgi:DNA-binding HxlR family transcriptional regulator